MGHDKPSRIADNHIFEGAVHKIPQAFMWRFIAEYRFYPFYLPAFRIDN
jgi:hypothetical protein